jgi:tripartite-type tricarboxylate transporter receptor subunit TctC
MRLSRPHLSRRGLLAAATLPWLPAVTRAQPAWPARPIRIIATFPPGGFADTIGRILTPHLSTALGQTVVIENRAGAGGSIGADVVAKSPPDGYTLVLSHASPHGIAPGIYPTLPYDPVRDFTHIAFICDTPNILMVPAASPYRTLAEYVAAAKARPGAIRYGSSGVGSTTHLMGELFNSVASIKLDHVPYRGSAPSLQDMLAGAIESMFDPITTNTELMKGGTVRVLAISSPRRIPQFPDVPTFAEQGFAKMTTSTWLGLSGPKGMAAPVVARLNAEMAKAVAQPDVRARLDQLASFPSDGVMTPEAYTEFVARFATEWTAISKAAGVVAQ